MARWMATVTVTKQCQGGVDEEGVIVLVLVLVIATVISSFLSPIFLATFTATSANNSPSFHSPLSKCALDNSRANFPTYSCSLFSKASYDNINLGTRSKAGPLLDIVSEKTKIAFAAFSG